MRNSLRKLVAERLRHKIITKCAAQSLTIYVAHVNIEIYRQHTAIKQSTYMSNYDGEYLATGTEPCALTRNDT